MEGADGEEEERQTREDEDDDGDDTFSSDEEGDYRKGGSGSGSGEDERELCFTDKRRRRSSSPSSGSDDVSDMERGHSNSSSEEEDTNNYRRMMLSAHSYLQSASPPLPQMLPLQHPTSRLSNLTSMNLSGCRTLTDKSLEYISSLSSSPLIRLDCTGCDNITDVGVGHLSRILWLEEVSFGWCRRITDVGIQALCEPPERSENLCILRIARLTTITDKSLEDLSNLRHLSELDLQGCITVTSNGVYNLIERSERLTGLDISYIPGVLKAWPKKSDDVRGEFCC